MKKAMTILGAVALGLTMSLSAAAADKTLIERHGDAWPRSEGGYVVKNKCRACHGDYAKLAEATARLEPNPHMNHLGDVNCVECHKPNLAKPELMCNTCHKFTIREKK